MKVIRDPKEGDILDARASMYPSYLQVFTEVKPTLFNAHDEVGTSYGYVLRGSIELNLPHAAVHLESGGYFSEADAHTIHPNRDSCVAVIRRLGFRGQSVLGRIEKRGRLSYIDGCSDSMLVYPPRLGDPVYNYLHFPEGIEQTQHTHPSIRLGIVAVGRGEAFGPIGQRKHIQVEAPELGSYVQDDDKGHWVVELTPGCVFLLEEQELHSFRTTRSGDVMDVIAFHPDSDTGPTDQNHPMANRTYIGGDVKRHSGAAFSAT